MQTCNGCGGAGCKSCIDQQSPKIFIPIEPMGAVRTPKAAGWGKYAAYKQELGYMAGSRISFIPEGQAIVITDLTFYMPMNENKQTTVLIDGKRTTIKTTEGMPHIKKPDIDNLIKGLFDSLNKAVWKDDAQVFQITNTKKVYSDYPGIEFGVEFV